MIKRLAGAKTNSGKVIDNPAEDMAFENGNYAPMRPSIFGGATGKCE
jgi:hypothetical protein